MKVGDYVRVKHPTRGHHRRTHGIIVEFDVDDDPVIWWSHKGKTWNETSYRMFIVILSETSGKEVSNA